jgi:phenylacetate-CoA ligase
VSFFKIKSLPGTTWPPIPLPQHSLVWSAYQALDRTQWLSPLEIEELQLEQLNTLLKHCYDNVPYYRNLLCKIGQYDKPMKSLSDFRGVPILTRSLYQENFEQIKTTSLPPGMVQDTDSQFTSGTNGVPIEVLKTNRDDMWWLAISMRDIEWCKMDPRKRVAAIRLIAMSPEELPAALEGISSPNWIAPNEELSIFESGPAFGLDIRQTPYKQIGWLKKISPAYLISLPSNLDVLASLLQETHQKISSLESIQVIGETLDPEVKSRIEKGFGVPVHDLYSANECGYIASQCPTGNGMHVHAETILTEVLDENDNPCSPGETGRLVLTNLKNFATPFIRYDILDNVTLADSPCSCGRGLPLWRKVEGRMHPMLFLSDGSRKASTGLMLGIRQIGGVHQFQVIQKSKGSFIVKVVPNHDWTEEHGLRMIRYIQNEVSSPVMVSIEKHTSLDRPNGKLKIITVEEGLYGK